MVSWPLGTKKPKTRQLHGTAGSGATWGAFWGFLFGLIFFVPFLRRAMGAGMGEIISTNLPEEQERRLREAFAQE